MQRINYIIITLLAALFSLPAASQSRHTININTGWKFYKGETIDASAATFDDSKWRTVDLPHDACMDETFVKDKNGANARNGYLPTSKGWYRRHISYEEKWTGNRAFIEFEGVYRDAKVFINGKKVSDEQPNGYAGFVIDITDVLTPGDNVIAVSYDNTYPKSSRWYNGEGINRDVFLHFTEPVHVAHDGTYITTPKITDKYARVSIATDVINQREDSVLCRLETEIIDPQGNTVAKRIAVAPFASGETYTFNQDLEVGSPQLWQVGKGILYKAKSSLFIDGKLSGN